MIPISTYLDGFGPHHGLAIDWSKLPSPVAIQAPYGTGKTFAAEALFAALYGYFPFYPAASLYDLLETGGDGVGRITAVFVEGAKRYILTRHVKNTGKTRTTTAVLDWWRDNDEMENIAGPKVSDVNEKIEALLGPPSLALATWFLSQSRIGDLVGRPGDKDMIALRRGVFNELVGAAHLQDLSKSASESAGKLDAVAHAAEQQLAGEPDFDTAIANAQRALDAANATILSATESKAKAEADRNAAQNALRDAQGGEQELRGVIAQADAARATLAAAEKSYDEAKRVVGAVIATLDELPAWESKVARLAEIDAELARLNGLQEQFAKHAEWDRKRIDVANAHERAVAATNLLKEKAKVSDEDRALAATLEQKRADYKALCEKRDKVRDANLANERTRTTVAAGISSLDQQIEAVQKRIDKAPEGLFGEKCNPCPLLAEFVGLPAQIEELKKRRAAAVVEKDAIAAAVPEVTGVDELLAAGKLAGAAAERVKAAAGALAEIQDSEIIANNARTELALCQNNEPVKGEDTTEKRRALTTERDGLMTAPMKLEEAKKWVGEPMKILSDALGGALAALLQASADFASKDLAAENARTSIASREESQKALQHSLSDAKARLAVVEEKLASAQSDLGSSTSTIASLRERATAATAKRADVRAKRADIEALRDVQTCFGVKGVRQLLIDQAAPALSAIADELFDIATGGSKRLRIATQTANRDGTVAEDFAILVRTPQGERDVLNFSGGQQQLFRILLRIAVALWVGAMRGKQPETLILDEAFDALGEEGAADLMRVLESIKDRVRYIVVVTHDQEIAAKFRSGISLSKGAAGVRVVLRGAVAA